MAASLDMANGCEDGVEVQTSEVLYSALRHARTRLASLVHTAI